LVVLLVGALVVVVVPWWVPWWVLSVDVDVNVGAVDVGGCVWVPWTWVPWTWMPWTWVLGEDALLVVHFLMEEEK
jgi:hypothetical protein